MKLIEPGISVVAHGDRKSRHPHDRPDFKTFFATVVKRMWRLLSECGGH